MKRTNILYSVSLCALLAFIGTGAQAQKKLSGKALLGSMSARHIGPATTSGRVSTIAGVNAEPTTFYVGTAGGGVWKTTSSGASFRPIFDDYSQSIGKITIDQNNPDTVWVGTGEVWVRNSVSVGTGIYKSTDGGTTWQFKGLPESERISDIIIHPKDPNTVYVGVMGHLWDANAERGVYKTTDGGDTWEKVLYLDDNTGVSDLDIDPNDPSILYAAMWSHRRYPWSFNSGMVGIKDYTPQSGLYKSTDGGANWNKIQNGLPKGTLGRMAIAVSPVNGNKVYLTVETKEKKERGLYLSNNKGSDWELVSSEAQLSVRPFYFSNLIPDPIEEDKLFKGALNISISEDGGKSFRTVSSAVHSDMHDFWIDPNNNKHILVGTDGGVYESYDGGYLFKMFMNLPVGQFYRVSIDSQEPYNVYGGLQDNGSWYAPSRKPGGIRNADWENSFGGDGFYTLPHPTDEDVVFTEYQEGNMVRVNKKTGLAKDIRPYEKEGDSKFRYNWNTPIHISPNNPERMYFASQFLFKTEDRGDSWERLSDDLTTNDKAKLNQKESGGISIDNSSAENHCTIYSVAESYQNENVIWVGTDDGNLQLSTNGGKEWTNVIGNITGLPANTWVSFIETGRFDANTVYVAFDGHRMGDKASYLYKSSDLGKTWVNLATEDIEGYALSVRQDTRNKDLIFLGTEFGLYVTIDGGSSWSRYENNVPKVGVRDMIIHPTENALVLGTHGRGIIIIDDISPLQQLGPEVLAKKLHFFDIEPTVLNDRGVSGFGGAFNGAGNFVGTNPSSAAQIKYFMNRRHTFGKMYIEIYDPSGKKIREMAAGKSAGINIVSMPTRLDKPRSAPTKNAQALFGGLFGPNLPAGMYTAKVVKGKESFETQFELKYDPEGPYSVSEREIQRKTSTLLFDLSERLAYVYYSLNGLTEKAEANAIQSKKLSKKLNAYAKEIKTYSGTIVSLEGDFYVDSGQALREKISDAFGKVVRFPGKPTDSQIKLADKLAEEMKQVDTKFKELTGSRLQSLNTQLEKADLKKMEVQSFGDFLKK